MLKRDRKLEKEVKKLVREFQCNGKPKPCRPICTIKQPACTVGTAHLEAAHFTEPQPIACKWCGSTDIMKYGTREGVQNFICKACGRKFTEKDSPYHMQTPTEQIGASLNMFYDGMSTSDIAKHLDETYHNPVNASTVYRWVLRYTFIALTILEPLEPKVSDTWYVDETVIKAGGKNLWFWDIIDDDTRFLLASHLSRSRTSLDASTVMRRAWKKAGKAPRFIVSDQLPAYRDGIELVFGAYSKHIQSKGFTDQINNNIIERFHGTIKDRTKVLRGFKTMLTAGNLLDGFLLHYNFFRPHMTLNDKTPAQVAGIKSPFHSWTDVVKQNKTSFRQVELRQKTPFGF
jgi:transposase-like protein